ncbi:site-specific integrase [Alcaligenes faecalis]|uniref:site-specific integrase n=1 Tax=Alcaligenes faecalis TaxID=511 RepID=UPI001FF753D4|nr:site-specific integrase [Alcaligenes faecalis]
MIESERAGGVWLSRGEAESTTLREALERYQAEIVPHKKGKVQEEDSIIRLLLTMPLALRPLASIRGADIASLRDAWLQDYAPATVLRRLAVLSHVFSVARKEWGMESLSNPVEVVRKPVANNARVRRVVTLEVTALDAGADEVRQMQDGELERVMAASSSALLPSIIRLAVETAMRRGEIVGLCWEHIDLERRVAHLPATKNGSTRDVPLSSRAVAVLQELRDGLDAKEQGQGAVFAMRPDGVTRAFERAVQRARGRYKAECEEAGTRPRDGFLVDFRFHDLRHEATSRLAEVFLMHELTKITGHRDPRMLMRYYHPKASELAKKLE